MVVLTLHRGTTIDLWYIIGGHRLQSPEWVLGQDGMTFNSFTEQRNSRELIPDAAYVIEGKFLNVLLYYIFIYIASR